MSPHPLIELLLAGKHDASYLEALEPQAPRTVDPVVVEADLRAAIEVDAAVWRLRYIQASHDVAGALDWRKRANLPSWDEVQRRRVFPTREQALARLADYGRRCREHDARCLALAGVQPEGVAA